MNKINEKIYNELKELIPFDERERKDKEIMLKYIETNEDVLTRENEIAHFTASAWIANKTKDKVLMIYHNIYNSWSWVGGHADGDNDLYRVINKEIEEETGLTNLKPLTNKIYGINIAPVDNHIKRGKQVASHLHLDVEYLFEADDSKTLRIKEDENSGVKWIPINEIEKYVTEERMLPIYQRLNDKLKNIKGE